MDELETARIERSQRSTERTAIAAQFPHIYHDNVFCDALHEALRTILKANPGLSLAEASVQLKDHVKNDSALGALKPAYDKLLAEIARYNRNPLDNRWIKDTGCWEKFVTAERNKMRAAS